MALWARRDGQVFAPWHLLGAASTEPVDKGTVTAACGQNLAHEVSMLERVDFEWLIGDRCPACEGVRWRTEPARFQRTRSRAIDPSREGGRATATAGLTRPPEVGIETETARSQLRKAVESLGPDWSHEIRHDPDGDPPFVVVFRRAGQRYFLVGGSDEQDAIREAMDWVDKQTPGRISRR
jgi:hypothetical protein